MYILNVKTALSRHAAFVFYLYLVSVMAEKLPDTSLQVLSAVLLEVIDNFLSVLSILCLETKHDLKHVIPYYNLEFPMQFSCTFRYTMSSGATDDSAGHSCLHYHLECLITQFVTRPQFLCKFHFRRFRKTAKSDY